MIQRRKIAFRFINTLSRNRGLIKIAQRKLILKSLIIWTYYKALYLKILVVSLIENCKIGSTAFTFRGDSKFF